MLLDEFDAIPDVAQRNLFAALLKGLGDRGVNLKFIFTGVGRSLEELLGAHLSAQRQIGGVEVPRLGWEARLEIVTEAARHFGLGMDNNVKYRIGILSDGFPAYVHLITEEMLWQAFDDSEICDELGPDHYLLGLRKAIGRVTMFCCANRTKMRSCIAAMKWRTWFGQQLTARTLRAMSIRCTDPISRSLKRGS
ncbi:hypothetical protein [Achromobacter spanius]|uniref:hypothetical protein n=1 Tax=Achromobacter spanius TaxID=217203 RepID=UPI0037FEF317